MTFHVLVPPGKEALGRVTKEDIKQVDINQTVNLISTEDSPWRQIKDLSNINYEAGDVICVAGLCPRQTTFGIAELAKSNKANYMPGVGVDHRGVLIEAGKIQHRLPIEKNHYTVWPYLAVIGNPETAKLSFELLEHLESKDYWPEYVPEVATIEHILAIVSATGYWETPDWFRVVDMSIRDLEIAPVMYSSHNWHDWIAFYPANGNFKLENHSQLDPVWLAGSEKPLEYWERG
jgi:hypothetical protein